MRESLRAVTPFPSMIACADFSLQAPTYPKATIPGSRLASLFSLRKSIMAVIPPASTNSLANYGLCLVTSLMTDAAIFRTPSSGSFSLQSILGKSSQPQIVQAISGECFAILARVWQVCFFSWAQWWLICWVRYGAAPASSTTCARSIECFAIQLRARAAMRFRLGSGSCKERTMP